MRGNPENDKGRNRLQDEDITQEKVENDKGWTLQSRKRRRINKCVMDNQTIAKYITKMKLSGKTNEVSN